MTDRLGLGPCLARLALGALESLERLGPGGVELGRTRLELLAAPVELVDARLGGLGAARCLAADPLGLLAFALGPLGSVGRVGDHRLDLLAHGGDLPASPVDVGEPALGFRLRALRRGERAIGLLAGALYLLALSGDLRAGAVGLLGALARVAHLSLELLGSAGRLRDALLGRRPGLGHRGQPALEPGRPLHRRALLGAHRRQLRAQRLELGRALLRLAANVLGLGRTGPGLPNAIRCLLDLPAQPSQLIGAPRLLLGATLLLLGAPRAQLLEQLLGALRARLMLGDLRAQAFGVLLELADAIGAGRSGGLRLPGLAVELDSTRLGLAPPRLGRAHLLCGALGPVLGVGRAPLERLGVLARAGRGLIERADPVLGLGPLLLQGLRALAQRAGLLAQLRALGLALAHLALQRPGALIGLPGALLGGRDQLGRLAQPRLVAGQLGAQRGGLLARSHKLRLGLGQRHLELRARAGDRLLSLGGQPLAFGLHRALQASALGLHRALQALAFGGQGALQMLALLLEARLELGAFCFQRPALLFQGAAQLGALLVEPVLEALAGAGDLGVLLGQRALGLGALLGEDLELGL